MTGKQPDCALRCWYGIINMGVFGGCEDKCHNKSPPSNEKLFGYLHLRGKFVVLGIHMHFGG